MIVAAALIAIPYAFAGVAKYNVEGARSGLLPVAYLTQSTSLTTCVGLFATISNAGGLRVNDTAPMPFKGYYVSRGRCRCRAWRRRPPPTARARAPPHLCLLARSVTPPAAAPLRCGRSASP